MPLTFNTGETKTFQLQAESYKAYPRHWVGREYKPCSGPGCALCAAGVAIRSDYMIPIAIAGVSDSYVFSSGVAQQLDGFTQQGYKLLGLMIKVTRTGAGRDTKYQTVLAAPTAPALIPAPGLTAAVIPIPGAVPTVTAQVIGQIARLRASDWAKLMSRLLNRKDYLDVIASELQAMQDEGLWQ